MKYSAKILSLVLVAVFVLALTANPGSAKDRSTDPEFKGYTPVSGEMSKDIMYNACVKEGTTATFTGNVFGNIGVQKGGTAIIKGTLNGNITNFGKVKIYGSAFGTLTNYGGTVDIIGTMTGEINKKGGTINIDKNGNFIGTQKDI